MKTLRPEELTVDILMQIMNCPRDEARIMLAYYQGRGVNDVERAE